MRMCCFVFVGFLLALRGVAQAPVEGGSQGDQAPTPHPMVHYVEKELRMPAPGAGARGLDVAEAYAQREGRHPLVLLTHGTSDKEEDRQHVTP